MNVRAFFVVLALVSSVAMTNNVCAMQGEDDKKNITIKNRLKQMVTSLKSLKNKLLLSDQTPETRARVRKIMFTLGLLMLCMGFYLDPDAIYALYSGIFACCQLLYESFFTNPEDLNGTCSNLYNGTYPNLALDSNGVCPNPNWSLEDDRLFRQTVVNLANMCASNGETIRAQRFARLQHAFLSDLYLSAKKCLRFCYEKSGNVQQCLNFFYPDCIIAVFFSDLR